MRSDPMRSTSLDLTARELALDPYPALAEERALGFTDPGEEHVMALAAAWSVDPTSLEERDVGGEDGLLGDFEAPADPRPPGPPPAKKPWWRFW